MPSSRRCAPNTTPRPLRSLTQVSAAQTPHNASLRCSTSNPEISLFCNLCSPRPRQARRVPIHDAVAMASRVPYVGTKTRYGLTRGNTAPASSRPVTRARPCDRRLGVQRKLPPVFSRDRRCDRTRPYRAHGRPHGIGQIEDDEVISCGRVLEPVFAVADMQLEPWIGVRVAVHRGQVGFREFHHLTSSSTTSTCSTERYRSTSLAAPPSPPPTIRTRAGADERSRVRARDSHDSGTRRFRGHRVASSRSTRRMRRVDDLQRLIRAAGGEHELATLI